MEKMLFLPLKKEWYEMIENGVKTEEYREIKPYWVKRLQREVYNFYDGNIYPGKNGIQDGVHSLEYAEFNEGMFKELGDIMWSCAQIAWRNSWTLEAVCKANLAKLADRAKRGVIVGNGDNR